MLNPNNFFVHVWYWVKQNRSMLKHMNFYQISNVQKILTWFLFQFNFISFSIDQQQIVGATAHQVAKFKLRQTYMRRTYHTGKRIQVICQTFQKPLIHFSFNSVSIIIRFYIFLLIISRDGFTNTIQRSAIMYDM